jgi:phosphoribosylformylglycinamidine synthase
LLEACLEVIATGAVVGMQDMGAAGIICSTAEMSAKGETGMRIDLDKVPTRQSGMKPWELLLSESQERMLMVVEKGKEKAVLDIFEKWDLPCSRIGEVTDDKILHFYFEGRLEAAIPADELVLGGGAPQYEREYREPAYFEKIRAFDQEGIPVAEDLRSVAGILTGLPSIASKRWISVQYDSTVGAANCSTNEPSDAAIVLVKGTSKGIVMTTDCNSRYVLADPSKGAMMAVAEAARNIVCSGGTPLGVTNCLNFGNPYQPEVYYQFVHAVKGMGKACVRFDTPVTGGNVSFYNQHPEGSVYPTPTIGMVGILENVQEKMTLYFKQAGDIILLIGKSRNDIHSSAYLYAVHGVEYSPAPHFDLEEEYRLQEMVGLLIKNRLVQSAHDIAEGGLFITLAECGFHRELGFRVSAADPNIRPDAYWFGEAQSRVVVSVKKEMLQDVKNLLGSFPFEELGEVSPDALFINGENWGPIRSWKSRYDNAIEREMGSIVEA